MVVVRAGRLMASMLIGGVPELHPGLPISGDKLGSLSFRVANLS